MYHINLQIGPASFRIGSDWKAVITQLDRFYSLYPRPAVADFTVRLEAAKPWRKYIRPSVRIEGDYMLPDAVPLPLAHGLLAAEMGMNLQMALGWRRQMILHASAAEKNGKALIMTGESGSGKSTLSALLGERGWRFFGDEFSLIDLDDGDCIPYPRLISLKNQSIKTMEAEVAEMRFGPLLRDTPKGDIRHLIPPAEAIGNMHVPATPALLLFPCFGYDPDVREMLPSETFIRLTQASTNFVGLGEAGFKTLTRFVDQVPAYALYYQTGDQAEKMIDDIWDRLK